MAAALRASFSGRARSAVAGRGQARFVQDLWSI